MSIATREVKVINELGLHVRPAGAIVKVANRFKSKIVLQKDDESVDAKSIMGVMMLAAEMGSIVKITADGEDAESAVESLVTLFNEGFGEMNPVKGSSG
jgi:phosphocarrier protein HPr